MNEPESRRIARDLHVLAALTQRVLEEGYVKQATGNGVTFSQISILKWLDSVDPRRAQDVAKFISASAPAATQILNRLKQKSLIKARPNPKDRRAEDLFLTPKAKKLVARYEDHKSRRLNSLLKRVPKNQRDEMTRGLETAISLLMRNAESVEDMCLHCGVYASPACMMRQAGYTCPTERPGLIPCGSNKQ